MPTRLTDYADFALKNLKAGPMGGSIVSVEKDLAVASW